MAKFKHFYLIRFQYLGFRFNGFQKQNKVGLRTIHEMIDKSLRFALGHENFKSMGSSRTDAMVSATNSAFELFLNEELELEPFLQLLNSNFPPDIRALNIIELPLNSNFNIIQSADVKEYHYYFAFGEKAHPFSAAFVHTVLTSLDVDLMKKGAELFIGKHDFRPYCTQPKPNVVFVRNVLKSEIVKNLEFSASFFPKDTWVYKVSSKGFMRNQVRLMMGQLILLGKHEITLEDIVGSLSDEKEKKALKVIAPASGLQLIHIGFKQ